MGLDSTRRKPAIRIFLIAAIIAAAAVVGCITQPPGEKVILEVNPVVDYYPLGGYAEKSGGVFAVLNGSIPEVKESLKKRLNHLLFLLMRI